MSTSGALTAFALEAGREQAQAKVIALFLAEPAKGVEQFRALFDRYRKDPEHRTDLNTANEKELLGSFAHWVYSLKTMYLARQSALQRRHLVTFAAPNGLLELYQDIILWPGFFSQDRLVLENILDGFAVVISMTPIEHVRTRLRPGAPRVWAHIWKNKFQYPLWGSRSEDGLVDGAEPGPDASSATVMLLQAYQGLYESVEEFAPVSTFIPQTVLYIWSRYDGHTSDFLMLDHVLNHVSRSLLFRSESSDALLREAIVDTNIGLDAFFNRLDSEIQFAHKLSEANLLDTYIGLLMLIDAKTFDLMPYLSKYQVVHHVLMALMDDRLLVKWPSLIQTWLRVFPVLRIAAQYFITNGTIVISGEDTIAFMSVSLTALVAEKRVSELNRQGIEECLSVNMQDYYRIAKIAGARTHWWPTLSKLRKAKRIEPNHQSLFDLWVGFGAVLGLDANRERQRHEEEERTRCSWRECPHRGNAVQDKPTTKKCTGCAETRYCSRECQLRDWKEGGHKARCKRIKNS
ncbi:unnamed protein product [Peniophora sp. CBMAI 1063]|nr:unnamed protein product [Peniophora sp. CBMAI 1063]